MFDCIDIFIEILGGLSSPMKHAGPHLKISQGTYVRGTLKLFSGGRRSGYVSPSRPRVIAPTGVPGVEQESFMAGWANRSS